VRLIVLSDAPIRAWRPMVKMPPWVKPRLAQAEARAEVRGLAAVSNFSRALPPEAVCVRQIIPSFMSLMIRPKVGDRMNSSRLTTFEVRPARRLATMPIGAAAMPAAARGVARAVAVSVAPLASEQIQAKGRQEAPTLGAEIKTGAMTVALALTVKVTRRSLTR